MYRQFRHLAEAYWKRHGLSGDGWEDALHDAVLEILADKQPEYIWQKTLYRVLDRHRKAYMRERERRAW